MTFKVQLRAGHTDDDNRTYLPEAIKAAIWSLMKTATILSHIRKG